MRLRPTAPEVDEAGYRSAARDLVSGAISVGEGSILLLLKEGRGECRPRFRRRSARRVDKATEDERLVFVCLLREATEPLKPSFKINIEGEAVRQVIGYDPLIESRAQGQARARVRVTCALENILDVLEDSVSDSMFSDINCP
jgi:hypothetical protein